MTSIGSYGKLQICPPDGTTSNHGHAFYLGQIYHAHNEDNDEDKNFNKNETLSFTQLLYLIDFYLHLLGACEPNNMIPVTIFYGLISDNAIKSPSLVKHATEKKNPYCSI